MGAHQSKVVPVADRYVLLDHSESKLLFVGKLDPVWEEMKKGVPDGRPAISFPLAPENGGRGENWDMGSNLYS